MTTIEILPETLPVEVPLPEDLDEEPVAEEPPPPATVEELAAELVRLEARLAAIEQQELDRAEALALRNRIRGLEEQLDFLTDRRKDVDRRGPPLDLQPRFHGDALVAMGQLGNESFGFDLGELRLGFESNLDRRIFLDAETLAEPEASGLRLSLDVLRFEARLGPVVRVTAGKFYTPVTRWAAELPVGSFQYTPVSLPLLMEPESRGGPLPLHQVGAEVALLGDVDLWSVGAAVGVGNGRGRDLAGTPDDGDTEAFKAPFARLWVDSPAGVGLGVSGYYDLIQPGVQLDSAILAWSLDEVGAAPVTVDRDVGELIGGANLVVFRPQVEVVVEGLLASHFVFEGDLVVNRDLYVLLAHPRRDATPYVAFDYVEQRPDDPLYSAMGVTRTLAHYHAGLRVDVGVHAALKGELGWLDAREHLSTLRFSREQTPSWRVLFTAGF